MGQPTREDIAFKGNCWGQLIIPWTSILTCLIPLTWSCQDGIMTATTLLYWTLVSSLIVLLKQGRRYYITKTLLKTGISWDLIRVQCRTCHHGDHQCSALQVSNVIFLYLVTDGIAVKHGYWIQHFYKLAVLFFTHVQSHGNKINWKRKVWSKNDPFITTLTTVNSSLKFAEFPPKITSPTSRYRPAIEKIKSAQSLCLKC